MVIPRRSSTAWKVSASSVIGVYTSRTVTSSVGAKELRQRLSEALDDVLRGETLEITRNGRLIATLAPVTREEVEDDDD